MTGNIINNTRKLNFPAYMNCQGNVCQEMSLYVKLNFTFCVQLKYKGNIQFRKLTKIAGKSNFPNTFSCMKSGMTFPTRFRSL